MVLASAGPLLTPPPFPTGLVVVSCTSHPGVLGSVPKREEPGKTGAPCVSTRYLTGPNANSFVLSDKHTQTLSLVSERTGARHAAGRARAVKHT
jgi:hypothetical protein